MHLWKRGEKVECERQAEDDWEGELERRGEERAEKNWRKGRRGGDRKEREEMNEVRAVDVHTLADHRPLHARQNFDGNDKDLYISLPYIS